MKNRNGDTEKSRINLKNKGVCKKYASVFFTKVDYWRMFVGVFVINFFTMVSFGFQETFFTKLRFSNIL
jgi:hypothetical protein